VLGLSWNRQVRNVLASSSADKTVKLWDLSKETCVTTMTHHTDKVQAVQWHPKEAGILLSGSFDRTVSVIDVRYRDASKLCSTPSDVEALEWNLHTLTQFFVSLEDGQVLCFDLRSLDRPLWTLQAHRKAASALSCNPRIPQLLATVSTDRTLKLWDLSADQPNVLFVRPSKFPLFSVAFYESAPHLLAAGGEGSESEPEERLFLFNAKTIEQLSEKFPH